MPTPQVTSAAMLSCTFGVAPASLVVLPVNRVTAGGFPAATIMDHVPIENIPPFGLCSSPANPEVIALTAAALGTPTPAPCVPVPPATWIPGAPTVTVGAVPALDMNCKLMCAWLGIIMVTEPAQFTVTVP